MHPFPPRAACVLLFALAYPLQSQQRGALLGDLTWPDAERRIREAPLVVVPFGAGAKEHGPHLPLATDRIVMEHFVRLAVDSLDVVVAPPILHGWFPAFRQFPGTDIQDPDVFQRYALEVARSLVRHGAKRVVFLNTGISKATGLPLSIAARTLVSVDRVPSMVVSWDDLETAATDSLTQQRVGGHADEIETSIILALRPDLVNMNRAVRDDGRTTTPAPGYRPGGYSRRPGDPDYSATGVTGDPTLATAEKGRRALEIMSRQWLRALRAFAATPLPQRRDPGS